MHAPYDRRRSDDRIEAKGGVGFFILVAAIPFVLIALTLQPKTSAWISQAVEAEFAGNSFVADAPTRMAQPNMTAPVQTVRAF